MLSFSREGILEDLREKDDLQCKGQLSLQMEED